LFYLFLKVADNFTITFFTAGLSIRAKTAGPAGSFVFVFVAKKGTKKMGVILLK